MGRGMWHSPQTLARVSQIASSDRGIALLLVLWVLTILMVIVLPFSVMTRSETHASFYFKQGMEKRFLAEAGVQRSVMELFHRGTFKGKQEITPGNEIMKVDGTPYTGQLGNDYYVYRVLDESAKINLNLLSDNSVLLLNNLLVNLGVQKETADTISDSILDWKDADELHRLHGAESEYYQTLPSPYKSKNGNFDTVEELLMVKGMTPEILYGNSTRTGIYGFVTVYSKVGGINVNTASREVLAALPGMTPETADQAIALRESAGPGRPVDLRPLLGDRFVSVAPYIGGSESDTYTIDSTGYKKAEKQGFTVRATVSIAADGKYSCLYYKSPAGVRY
jgi:general secretion pathway protein K